jgi:hypothetical protein
MYLTWVARAEMHAGAKFDFVSYMRSSMEDDYGQLVGLGLPMWLFLIFFVLLSSVWGDLFTTTLLPVPSILRKICGCGRHG